ncbi:beta-L-arabinofuranosidase domain-containing protein, partial [Alistipes senegalensis]
SGTMKKTMLLICAALLAGAVCTTAPAQEVPDLKGGPMGVERIAKLANYSVYSSVPADSPTDTCWMQVDLGRSYPIDQVKLYPVIWDWWLAVWRPRFPVRFKLEAADNEAFDNPRLISDQTAKDYEVTIVDKVDSYAPSEPVSGRYVRLTVTKLPEFQKKYSFDLWRFEVISGGKDIAEGRTLSDSGRGYLGKHQLLRAPRPMGELAVLDCPENVTSPDSWRPVKAELRVPHKGVRVGGLFGKVMDRNAHYLLTSFTVNDMLRDFRIRAGKPVSEKKDRDIDIEWLKYLPGSVAGRFLMGTGNQLRWKDDPELRKRMNQIVDGIEECAEPNGYLVGYPENEILVFEYGGYCRSWVSQGLLEAAIAGNTKAYPMLRKFYDWFNTCPYLPELVRRGAFGRQGIIPSTRLYHTPVGKPLDIQVAQRYYQENFWMDQLADRDVDAIWKIPYDRPHCYLIVTLNAYMDMYMATGEERYLEAVLGGWDIYHDYFQHTGGSISICEKLEYPPKSYLLRLGTGELCGNSFWSFLNQQLHAVFPDEEKYANEIEKSIYNVGIANQTQDGSIIYHAMLVGHKNRGENHNTCCEGQGTRWFGALPEFIYSIADDGIYVNLFNESTIEWTQSDGNEMSVRMQTAFPENPEVKLTVSPGNGKAYSNIRLRVPQWADAPMEVTVNGKRVGTGRPGSYLALKRTWKKGDVIAFTLPIGFRLTKYNGTAEGFKGTEAYALEYGPLLMAAMSPSEEKGFLDIPVAPSELPSRLKPENNDPLRFKVECSEAGIEYVPYYRIADENFTCYPFLKKAE